MKALIILAAALTCGCASSLRYSPALNLPAAPLPEHTGQLAGGGALLPETRPSAVRRTLLFGGEAAVSYAFSQKFSMKIKGWKDLDLSTGGFAVSGEFSDDGGRFSVIPAFAFLLEKSSAEGFGAAVYAAWRLRKHGDFRPYLAVAPAFGFKNFSFDDNDYGYGLIANAGATYLLSGQFSLNAELAVTASYNRYDEVAYIIPSPSLMAQWAF